MFSYKEKILLHLCFVFRIKSKVKIYLRVEGRSTLRFQRYYSHVPVPKVEPVPNGVFAAPPNIMPLSWIKERSPFDFSNDLNLTLQRAREIQFEMLATGKLICG